ncbi:hypothetical protein KY363_05780 [Candidatus Woesearchaeota archaeon]|nr:hypothetical protein [Candidatus Woesearchaeota archaeon]
MGCKKVSLWLILCLLFASPCFAATLHGKIYDLDLNELNDVVVTVDSTPPQRFVSKDGAYSFQLETGRYTITANHSVDRLHELTTSENVTITSDGDYVFDLFLLPELDIDDSLFEGVDEMDISNPIETSQSNALSSTTFLLLVIAFLVFLVILYFIVGHVKKKEEIVELQEVEKVEAGTRDALRNELEEARISDGNRVVDAAKAKEKAKHDHIEEDLHRMLTVIEREGGRVTQKELRKEFPLSEAKISLMVSELEHKGLVKKVKKGRGNIILLKKKK